MKNALKYLQLWQKKRNELPITDDQQADWMQMHAILDQQMPATDDAENEKPSRSKGFKLLSMVFISLSAAAMTYVVSHVVAIQKHKHHHTATYDRHHKGSMNNNIAVADTTDSTTMDSLSPNQQGGATTSQASPALKPGDSLQAAKQSSLLQNPPAASKNTAKPPTLSAQNTVNNKEPKGAGRVSSSASAKTGAAALNAANKNQIAALNRSNGSVTPSFINSGGRFNHHTSTGLSRNRGNLSPNNPGGNNPRNLTRTVYQRGASDKNDNYPGNTLPDANGDTRVLLPSKPSIIFNSPTSVMAFSAAPVYFKTVQKSGVNKSSAANKTKKDKAAGTKRPKSGASGPSNFDWGILTGVNTSGSFTAKQQNSNFYGSGPVDAYFGLSTTYHINDSWALNSQVKFFSPQTINTSYSHSHQSKIDSGQMLQITSSRKSYAVEIPLHLVYKANANVSFKAGPVISIPVKQINLTTTFQPAAIKSDTTYYPKLANTLNGTKFTQSLNIGLSGGVNFHVKRFSIEATYLRSLSGYQVTSDFGSYKSYNGTFQLTFGFQLNKPKR